MNFAEFRVAMKLIGKLLGVEEFQLDIGIYIIISYIHYHVVYTLSCCIYIIMLYIHYHSHLEIGTLCACVRTSVWVL